MKAVQATREAFIPKREHPALQIVKFLHFFQFSWVIFYLLDPDSATKIDADPDPEHWWTNAKSIQAFSEKVSN